MTPGTRVDAWHTAERLFAELHISIGTHFPVALGIEVEKEEMIQPLRDALARVELQTAEVIKKKWPFGHRWLLEAKSQPRAIIREDIEAWLDSIEPTLRDYDAELITWVPLVPAA